MTETEKSPRGFDRQSVCEDCNIYMDECNGFERWEVKGKERVCRNRVQCPANTPNPIQVVAFQSLYKTKRRCGKHSTQAFAEAIVQTSDDAFAEAQQESPEKIERYKKPKEVL